MSLMHCHYCGSSHIRTKELEIRSVNANTMKIKSSERVTELECKDCGWIGSLAPIPAGVF
jgi:predicted nucleic-acid-binding Zn-ribbon protein